MRLSRDIVLWLVPTSRNHPQRPPANDLVLPPFTSGPQTTQLAVPRRLSHGERPRFIHASGRWTTWLRSARTPAYNKSFYGGRPADNLVATGNDFGQSLSFRTADLRRATVLRHYRSTTMPPRRQQYQLTAAKRYTIRRLQTYVSARQANH